MKKEREKRESRIWSSETIQTNYTKSESLIFFKQFKQDIWILIIQLQN